MKTDRMTSAEFRALHCAAPVVNTGKPQIRVPKKRKMNKTEEAWLRQLQSRFSTNIEDVCSVLYEPFSLNLPSGTWYTPDFAIINSIGRVMEIWEVKGKHIHNQRSIHAWKEARAAFPFWRFGFAQLRGTEWAITIE